MQQNADPAELAKFDTPTDDWWSLDGEFKPLHEINPLRLRYVTDRAALDGKRVLDVGCGGGIFSEALSKAGGHVTGIDLAGQALMAANRHAADNGLDITYREISAEELAMQEPGQFDVVTCLEMLEHVPDPASVVRALGKLVVPGGDVFLSTINRNPKSYLFGIVAAERILRLLPAGTHDHAKFITPAEMARYCREAQLQISDVGGMTYNPITKRYRLSRDIDVNYLAHARHNG